MTSAINTIIDSGLYDMLKSPLYVRNNLREQDIYNVILPNEQTVAASAPTEVPQELNFVIANKNWIDTIQSAFNFQIGVPFTQGDLTGKVVFQKDCAIYTQAVDYSGSPTLKCRLPLQTQNFFKEIQVQKQNHNGEDLNLLQEHKFRESNFASLVGQEFVNRTNADNVLFNNNTKVIYVGKSVGDTSTMIWLNFTFPFANICPLLAIYPFFPMEMLNDSLKIRFVPNVEAFQSVGTQYCNWQLKMQLIKQSGVAQELRNERIHGVFPDYKYIPIFNKTFGEPIEYQIQNKMNSLDFVQILMSKNTSNTNYKLGFANLTKDTPYEAAEKYTIGGFQLEHDSTLMFIHQLDTWNDITRQNMRDGHQLSQFNKVSSNKTADYNFNEWVNCFKFKLNDEMNVSTTTTGFTGIPVSSLSNTFLRWKGIYDYSANLKIGQILNTTDTVNYELFMYYSRLMTIEGGNIVLE